MATVTPLLFIYNLYDVIVPFDVQFIDAVPYIPHTPVVFTPNAIVNVLVVGDAPNATGNVGNGNV